MSSSAITTQVAQLKIGNVQNQADSTSVYSNGVWSFKNSTAVTSVTITDAGNVGIGTASPTYRLQVARDGGGGDSAQFVRISDTSTANAVGPMHLTIGAINHFAGNPSMALAGSNGISFCVGDGSDFNAQRKMYIDASGNLLVGTASLFNGDYRIQLSPAAGTGVIVTRATTASHVPMAFQNSAGTAIGSIACSNSATSFNPSSDRRLKENIESLDNALEVVKKLRPRKYTWKIDGSHDDGFIAQELQEIEEFKHRVAVIGKVEEEEYYGVDYMRFVTYLTAAIQELSAKNDALEARLAASDARLAALEAK